MGLESRAYRRADLGRVTGLLEARLGGGLGWNLSVADLRRVLSREETQAERYGRVWEAADGRVVGFGLLWVPGDTVYVLVHPAYERATAGADGDVLAWEVLGWAERLAGELTVERGRPVLPRVRVRDSDGGLVGLLERRGYAQEARHTLRYRRSLAVPFGMPELPPGFVIRHVRGEDEVDAYVALHREAFGTEHMNAAARLAIMRDPSYVPELDLVAVAPDGELAAFVLAEIDREASRAEARSVGSTDPLGTRPRYRRMGLARALLLEAFGRLRERGVEQTTVGTGSWNQATIALLESVGYELEYRLLAYAKSVA